jgi:methylase of polypeptide subunit release factors
VGVAVAEGAVIATENRSTDHAVQHGLTAEALRSLAAWALAAGREAGLDERRARAVVGRLIPKELREDAVVSAVESAEASAENVSVASLGQRYETLLAVTRARAKKRAGTFYTPSKLARELCRRALEGRVVLSVIDPACGAGAVLLEALAFAKPAALYAIDLDPAAVWLARVALALASGRHDDASISHWIERVRVADALLEQPFDRSLLFDAVVGNPPWVSYAGRSAERLDPMQKRALREKYRAFSGFPTAHGMFIERAATLLADGGRLALLVPTTVADLDGYRATREALASRAHVDEPVDELGFDQFDGVVQPTMILCATARPRGESVDQPSRRWSVASARLAAPRPLLAPSLVARLEALARFPKDTFGEGGFQSAGTIAKTHLGPLDEPRFSVPLREGADVVPFACRAPSLGLDPSPDALAVARCTLRPQSFYDRVTVLVRQTARYPIACRHDPSAAFRNSLLAGFSSEPDALCALLNSALLRAWHLSTQRDGRQAVFPQVKVAHLRALPAPPEERPLAELAELAREAERHQRARLALARESSRSMGVSERAFDVVDGEIAGSPSSARALRDEEARRAFDAAIEQAREHWRRARAVLEKIDENVCRIYGVTDEERASIDAVLAWKQPKG